jgi:hypothetical protein
MGGKNAYQILTEIPHANRRLDNSRKVELS